MQAFLIVSLALFGAVFGSFANVVIWRFPRGESLSQPPSHCPRCGHPIRWHDNIPVLGWIVLRGRCRDCGDPISWRYPAVEALSALLWAAAGLRFGTSGLTASCVAFFYLLMILAFIDIDTMRLPNSIVAILASWGSAAAILSELSGLRLGPLLAPSSVAAGPLAVALAGALLGAGPALGVAVLYRLVRGRSGFGMGDIKLLGAMGLFLGPYVLVALFLGSVLGSVGGVLQLRSRRDGEAPEGAEAEAGSGDAEGTGRTGEDVSGPPAVGESAGAATPIPESPGGDPEMPEDDVPDDADALPLARRKFAFGPYLALGGVLTALFGPSLWTAYLRLAAVG